MHLIYWQTFVAEWMFYYFGHILHLNHKCQHIHFMWCVEYEWPPRLIYENLVTREWNTLKELERLGSDLVGGIMSLGVGFRVL